MQKKHIRSETRATMFTSPVSSEYGRQFKIPVFVIRREKFRNHRVKGTMKPFKKSVTGCLIGTRSDLVDGEEFTQGLKQFCFKARTLVCENQQRAPETSDPLVCQDASDGDGFLVGNRKGFSPSTVVILDGQYVTMTSRCDGVGAGQVQGQELSYASNHHVLQGPLTSRLASQVTSTRKTSLQL